MVAIASRQLLLSSPSLWSWVSKVAHHVWLFATPWTVAHQAPLSMGFPRQEYWSRFPCLPPGDLPNPGMELASTALPLGGFFTTEPLEKMSGKESTCQCRRHKRLGFNPAGLQSLRSQRGRTWMNAHTHTQRYALDLRFYNFISGRRVCARFIITASSARHGGTCDSMLRKQKRVFQCHWWHSLMAFNFLNFIFSPARNNE